MVLVFYLQMLLLPIGCLQAAATYATRECADQIRRVLAAAQDNCYKRETQPSAAVA